jgi:putative CocE/NonD family hydrolase
VRLFRSVLWLLVVLPCCALAQEFDFKPPPRAADPAVAQAMRDLAERVLPVYEEADRTRYLANLSALQLVAGEYEAADDTRRTLRERRQAAGQRPDGRSVLMDLYARARSIATSQRAPFPQAFSQSFREVVARLNDADAEAVTAWLGTPIGAFERALQDSLDRVRVHRAVGLDDAMQLMWSYLAYDAYRSFGGQLETLSREDAARRYLVEESVIRSGRAQIHARIVRSRKVDKSPTLLQFTIDAASAHDIKSAVAHGYAGVVAYTRGLGPDGRVSGEVVPFEHDGDDARAVIRWIAAQAWSDGRVGMYGSGYAGFAAWAVAKRAPSPLKSIVTQEPLAPGIDFPAEGRVFRNSALRWLLTATGSVEGLNDDAAWRDVDLAWYRSGKPYRDLGRAQNRSSPLFRRWLSHPSYDRYWQKMLPVGAEFARIDLPILTMSGYGGPAEVGALHYFTQHLRHRPKADHALVLGMRDDATTLGGSTALPRDVLDPAARIDARTLRFQWFDHVFKGAPKPALLRDRVNVQSMGTGEWRSATSLDRLASAALTFHLDGQRLAPVKPTKSAAQELTVNFADRSDAAMPVQPGAASKPLPLQHALRFTSEPLPQPLEITGGLSGRLDLKLNRSDVDLSVALYAQEADGDHVLLLDPYEFRASYARDRFARQPLQRGARQKLAFASGHFVARKLEAGSRLVLVLGVNKRADREINHGSGKVVSEETVKDGKTPLKIQFFNTSTVEIDVRK